MQLMDWILVALVGALLALALWRMHENKRRGKGCCGNCSGCAQQCSHRKFHEK